MQRQTMILAALLGVIGIYGLGYVWARIFVFQAVEFYAGAEFKSFPRQDYIAKKDQPPGTGWEYFFFLPLIRLEERVLYLVHNR